MHEKLRHREVKLLIVTELISDRASEQSYPGPAFLIAGLILVRLVTNTHSTEKHSREKHLITGNLIMLEVDFS